MSNNSYIQWVDGLQSEMETLLEKWVNINSGSSNLEGLKTMWDEISQSFGVLGGAIQKVDIGPQYGACISIRKRPEAPIQVLFSGHMDTVYEKDHPFQGATRTDAFTLRGPGAADMKSGLIVILNILKAFERTPDAANIGWEVFINSDEEIASVGSAPILLAKASQFNVGLVFEPCYTDGSLVSGRKGSINFTVTSHGRSAHAGRDIEEGRNAIVALSKFILKTDKLQDHTKGITVNVGTIVGGDKINVVPNLAECQINMRMNYEDDLNNLEHELNQFAHEESLMEGIHVDVVRNSVRHPKPFTEGIQKLFHEFEECAKELEQPELTYRTSGGVCDGNTLFRGGLNNIDTLGPIGGNLHTDQEFVKLDSLVPKVKLTLWYLMRLAKGDFR